jgi:hypothetical protein
VMDSRRAPSFSSASIKAMCRASWSSFILFFKFVSSSFKHVFSLCASTASLLASSNWSAEVLTPLRSWAFSGSRWVNWKIMSEQLWHKSAAA